MMNKSFCITIDTEPDCTVDWKRSQPLTYESVLMGIPELLRPVWNRYNIKPVYFVSPEVVGDDRCCEVLRSEIVSGAEIGSHLHSEYIEPQKKHSAADGTVSNEFPCFAYSDQIEYEKIRNLTDLIKVKLNITPVSYRAARYGADIATVKSLQKLGYKVDSSVTPKINWSNIGGPDHSKAPDQPYFISPDDYYRSGESSILEVPITIARKRLFCLPQRWFFYRWLRPSIMTAFEMKALIREFVRSYENPVLTMMFHSMEIIPGKSPYVRTKRGQQRFLAKLQKTIQFLCEQGFQSRTLGSVYEEKLREIQKPGK